jgi:hypothetical protein
MYFLHIHFKYNIHFEYKYEMYFLHIHFEYNMKLKSSWTVIYTFDGLQPSLYQ